MIQNKDGTFLFGGKILSLPVYGDDGLAAIRDQRTSEVFYRGPGKHEVFPPAEVLSSSLVVERLLAWVKLNGWDDLQVRGSEVLIV